MTNTATLYNGVTTNVAVAYDSLGNITSKSDVGAYAYKQACNGITAGPHAASTVAGKAYCYDANGSQISGDGRTITYTPFNKPSRIVKAGNTTDFFYGPERDYYKKVESGTQGASTTVIVGAYEKETKGTVVTHRVQVGDSILIETKNNVQSTLFLIKDHLGSLVTVIDSLGTIKERLSYDPWGKRRAPTGTSINLLTLQTLYTDRGYTGHLHADGVGLVHMNGRMYDPILARFISADPLIQSPNNLQSLNRYSYVMNNPLSYTDPSGYLSNKFKMFRRLVYTVAAFALCGPTCATMAYSARQSRDHGANTDQVIKATWNMAVASAMMYGAGGIPDPSMRVFAHAMIGGGSSAVAGGSFKNGFISAGLVATAGALGLTEDISSALGGGEASKAGNVIASALIGGVASKASGGEFAEGAVKGAMQQIMNGNNHEDQNDPAFPDWFVDAFDVVVSFVPLPHAKIAKFGAQAFKALRVDKMLGGAASKLDDAIATYKKNDIHHLFGRGGAAPTKLLEKFGSPEAALRELQKAAQSIDLKNYETGRWVAVKVGDIPVGIKGNVVDGVFRISSIAKKEF